MERSVTIDGKEVRMRASALIPRLYRYHFKRDAITDMMSLSKAFKKAQSLPADATDEERMDAQLSVLDLTIFENMAWLMIRNAGEDIPGSPDEWLDSIDGVFDIYQILPVILELWGENNITTSVPRKK